MNTNEKPGGSTPSQYSLPPGAKELQDLIEHRNMNFAQGNIFKAQYRRGTCSHSDELRDARKTLWFAQREVDRLEAEEAAREGKPLEKREVPPPGFTPLTSAALGELIPDMALLPLVAKPPAQACTSCAFELNSVDEEPCVGCLGFSNWRLADDHPGSAPGFTPLTLAKHLGFSDPVEAKPTPLNVVVNPPAKACTNCKFEGIMEDAQPCISCFAYDNWEPEKAEMGILDAMGL